MTNETMVTIQGWIGNDPTLRMVGEAPVINFRVGATPRRFNRRTSTWSDGPTQWYTVNAWRQLAEHAERSLGKGDPVVVHGRLNHRTYVNTQGVEVVSLEIEAITIGHDLNRGTSRFRRVTTRVVDPSARATSGPADLAGPPEAVGGRADLADVREPGEGPWAEVPSAPATSPEGTEDPSRSAA